MNVKKIAQFAIGPIGVASIGFGSLPFVTRLFSQEDIGRIAMFHIATNMCILLFGLGLDQAYVREYHETTNKVALLKEVLLPGFLLLIGFISLIELSSLSIAEILFDVRAVVLEVLIITGIFVSFLSRFLLLALRMKERAFTYSINQILPKLIFLAIIFSYILFDFETTFAKLLTAHVVSGLAMIPFLVWHNCHENVGAIEQPIDKLHLFEMIKYGYPLVLGGLAYWGLTASDKVFLRSLSTYTQLGLYSVAVSMAAGAAIFSNIFSTVWAPTVYKWAANNENFEKVDQVTEYALSIIVLFFCLSGMLSGLITKILPDSYLSVHYILMPCLGSPLMYALSETTVVGLGISKKTVFAMVASVGALLFNLFGNYLLIPKYGAVGAAISTSFSFWVFLLLRTEFSYQVWRPFPRIKLYIFSFTCIAIASLSALRGEVLGYWLQCIWFGFMLICSISFFQQYKNIIVWLSDCMLKFFHGR